MLDNKDFEFFPLLLILNHFRRPTRYQKLQTRRTNSFSFWQKVKRGMIFCLVLFLVCSISLVAIFSKINPPTTAFMLQQHWQDFLENAGYQPISQNWISKTEISGYASDAVIASEDQLFYKHNGFDVHAINQAFNRYQHDGKLRGASTISQQVAKNLFLSPAKNFLRKGLEIWFTVLIEMIWDKSRILEMYLNIAEFGDHLFGIEAASRRYFGIAAKQLNAEQAALLAATLPNPLQLKADQPSEYLYKRQKWILGQMRNLNYPSAN
jgi:monofunctional biosynthetic peptidoglycan transglycosylase